MVEVVVGRGGIGTKVQLELEEVAVVAVVVAVVTAQEVVQVQGRVVTGQWRHAA